jgi:transposase-like protein
VKGIQKKAPIKRSKEEREELVAKWRASGKSATRFAAEHGLAHSSLYQWIHPRDYGGSKKGKDGKRKVAAAKATFAEVEVVDEVPARGPVVTVALRCGHQVTFEGTAFDAAWLESVLKVVNAC